MPWNLGPQNLDWVSPTRQFATQADVFNSQPNYEHEIAVALDTGIKYQGSSPTIGGWVFATGVAVPGQPPVVTPPVNDGFTVLLLEFDGKQGSRTLEDTNAAGWPRLWTVQRVAGAFGTVTNVGEQFFPGALTLDGNTVITAPDDIRWDLNVMDFTVRGWFKLQQNIAHSQFILAKGDEGGDVNVGRFTFFVGFTAVGQFMAGGTTVGSSNLLDRGGIQIVDRTGQDIQTRAPGTLSIVNRLLLSAAFYSVSDTWHSFEYKRTGGTLRLKMDGVEDDTEPVGSEVFGYFTGPLTIGDFGPPLNNIPRGHTFKGGIDRLAVDMGVAR